jgi:ribosome-associated protein
VNTTDSRVEVSFDVASSRALGPVLRERALRALAGRLAGGVITVSASEHRSQLRNREAALSRLAALLTAATAPPPAARRPTRPSRAATERRLAAKRRRYKIKRWRADGDSDLEHPATKTAGHSDRPAPRRLAAPPPGRTRGPNQRAHTRPQRTGARAARRTGGDRPRGRIA